VHHITRDVFIKNLLTKRGRVKGFTVYYKKKHEKTSKGTGISLLKTENAKGPDRNFLCIRFSNYNV